MNRAIYTSFSFSYLNRAKVLAQSIRRVEKDVDVIAVITDEWVDKTQPFEDDDFDKIIYADDMIGSGFKPWIFTMDVVEACTAVKGAAFEYLFDKFDYEKIIYLDPDIAVLNSLEKIWSLLDSNSIVLTPHQVEPEPADAISAIWDNEITSLDFGDYNFGFLGVKNSLEGRRMTRWWDDRLRVFCYDEREKGLFVDQKWGNLVPCLFDEVFIERGRSFNVASWNLSHRTLSFSPDGQMLVNGDPLCFFHFTKLGPLGRTMTRRYAQDNYPVYELWRWYEEQVRVNTDPAIPNRYWVYDSFYSGKKLERPIRRLFRDRPDLQSHFADPFDADFEDWVANNYN